MKIIFSAQVFGVDLEKPAVFLKHGTSMEADLVVGADGIRSVIRGAVAGNTEFKVWLLSCITYLQEAKKNDYKDASETLNYSNTPGRQMESEANILSFGRLLLHMDHITSISREAFCSQTQKSTTSHAETTFGSAHKSS